MKKIYNYNQFLNEKYIENPEYRIKVFFDKLEKRIKKWFTEGSFQSSGAELIDIKRSTMSFSQQDIIFNFIDNDFYYQVYIILSIEDVSETSLDECYVKVKKYDQEDGKLIDELGKDMTVDELDEDAILQLYSDLEENINNLDKSSEEKNEKTTQSNVDF
jgi:hypothetical protein